MEWENVSFPDWPKIGCSGLTPSLPFHSLGELDFTHLRTWQLWQKHSLETDTHITGTLLPRSYFPQLLGILLEIRLCCNLVVTFISQNLVSSVKLLFIKPPCSILKGDFVYCYFIIILEQIPLVICGLDIFLINFFLRHFSTYANLSLLQSKQTLTHPTFYISDVNTQSSPYLLKLFFLNRIFVISCLFLLHNTPVEKGNLHCLFTSAFSLHYIFQQQTCSSANVATLISEVYTGQARSLEHLHFKRQEVSCFWYISFLSVNTYKEHMCYSTT